MAGDGGGSMNSIAASEGGSIILPSCTFSYNGYTFSGWSTVYNGSIETSDGGSFDMEHPM